MSEIGKKYGKLTIIKKLDKKEFTCHVYLCQCDCGNFKEVNINKLHTGHTKSCGCLNHKIKDLTGKRFARLIVSSLKGREGKKTLWNCTCDCGNKCIASTAGLTTGTTTSCGCKNKENQVNFRINDDLIDGTRLSSVNGTRKTNKNNKSGYTGVSYDNQRKLWVAQITYQRKNHLIGRFKTKEEAIKAREAAEIIYFGKYRKKDN